MKTIYAVLQNNKVEMSANFSSINYTIEYDLDIEAQQGSKFAKSFFIASILAGAGIMGGEEIVIYDANNKTKATSLINPVLKDNYKKAKKLSKVFSIKDGNISLDGEKILIFDKQ